MARSGRDARRAGAPVLWPWDPTSAWRVAGGALVLLLVASGVARAVMSWPGEGVQGWVLLGAVTIALLPVLALVVDRVATQGGEVRVAGVALRFAQTSEAVAAATRTTTLAEDLGTPDDRALESSGLRSILRELRRAHDSNVTVVDLRKGDTWWESRLFILVAGAAHRGAPQAIAFVADQGGRTGVFLGWASPARLLERHVAAMPALGEAYRSAVRDAAVWDLTKPDPAFGPPGQAGRTPWNQNVQLPTVEGGADPRFAMELYLQQALESRDPSPLGGPRVTAQRVRELYEAVLRTGHVESDAPDGEWAALLASTPGPFVAVTRAGTLRALVARDTLVSALVAALVRAAAGD